MAQQQQQRRDEFANAPRAQDRDRDDVRNKNEQFGTTDPVVQYTYYEANVATGYGAPTGGVPPGAYGVPDYGTGANVGSGTNYDTAGYGTTTGYGATTAGYGTTGVGVGAGQWGQDATAAGGGGGGAGGGGGDNRGMDMNRNKVRDQK